MPSTGKVLACSCALLDHSNLTTCIVLAGPMMVHNYMFITKIKLTQSRNWLVPNYLIFTLHVENLIYIEILNDKDIILRTMVLNWDLLHSSFKSLTWPHRMKVDMFLNFTLKSYLPNLLRILHYVINDISGIHFILRFLPHRASCEVIVYLTRYSRGEGSVNIYNPGLGSSTHMDTKYSGVKAL